MRVERITTEEILAGLHDFDTTGRKAKCSRCGRLAIEVMDDDASPGCSVPRTTSPRSGDTKP